MKTEPLKIYRNGKYDIVSTYKPLVKRSLLAFGNKVDFLFVNGRWPTR